LTSQEKLDIYDGVAKRQRDLLTAHNVTMKTMLKNFCGAGDRGNDDFCMIELWIHDL